VLTAEILSVLTFFSSKFTRPTWKNSLVLLQGAILCRGPRRVSGILRVMGLESQTNFSKYHRVLSQAQWDSVVLGKILLGLLIKALPSDWPILVVVDETLERRKGKKIKAKGLYRDAVRSTKKTGLVKSFGLKWECMMLIVPLPWCKRPWALPFLTVLAPSQKANEQAGRRHKTSLEWTRQMVKLVSRWIRRSWILIGDGTYACIELAHTCTKSQVTLVSRLRLDAQLFEFPIYQPRPGVRGRKPIKGKRIRLAAFLNDPNKQWQDSTLTWYGAEEKIISYLTLECLWYNSRSKPVTVRVVLVTNPDNKHTAEVFFSTNTSLSPEQIIRYYVLRWNIEVTFEETRAHLGFETQRQWSDKAIARSTPLLMALFSLIALVGMKMNETKKLISMEMASWYDKHGELTFSDIIALVRRDIWSKKYFLTSTKKADAFKWNDKDINSLIYQLSIAA
jgi:hypothetical protein